MYYQEPLFRYPGDMNNVITRVIHIRYFVFTIHSVGKMRVFTMCILTFFKNTVENTGNEHKLQIGSVMSKLVFTGCSFLYQVVMTGSVAQLKNLPSK